MKLEDKRFFHCGSRGKCKTISRIFQVSPLIEQRGVVVNDQHFFFFFLKDFDNNWKTGNYQMKIESWYGYLDDGARCDGDHIIYFRFFDANDKLTIFNTRTMEEKPVSYQRKLCH